MHERFINCTTLYAQLSPPAELAPTQVDKLAYFTRLVNSLVYRTSDIDARFAANWTNSNYMGIQEHLRYGINIVVLANARVIERHLDLGLLRNNPSRPWSAKTRHLGLVVGYLIEVPKCLQK